MLLVLDSGTTTWNDSALPLNVAVVLVQALVGADTTGELNRMNALLVSKLFVLVKFIVTFPPLTFTPPAEKLGGGTKTTSTPALLNVLPALLVTPTV